MSEPCCNGVASGGPCTTDCICRGDNAAHVRWRSLFDLLDAARRRQEGMDEHDYHKCDVAEVDMHLALRDALTDYVAEVGGE